MTLETAPDGSASRAQAEAPTALTARVTAVLSLLALFLLSRPYFGIRHDARIYVGRAEADLGRAGMAQDLMFVHDGQSKFSMFGALFRPVVEHLGSAHAAMLATVVGLAFWLFAAVVLMSRICKGVPLWAAVAALATLPAYYAGVLAYGEPFITPRMFAEALVCLSLACVLDQRWIAGGALLAFAAALHPIMTAPGVAVFGLMLVLQDRRWLIPAVLGVAAALAAAFAGAPLIERLTTPIDAAWLAMLQQRSVYLFPSIWNDRSWLMLIRQGLTLVIAASFLQGRTRRFAFTVLAVGVVGVFVTMAVPTLLVIQMQPWRGQWLVALLSTAVLPFAIAQLWRDGSGGRAAAALLAIAWGAGGSPYLGAATSGLALAIRFLPQARNLPPLAWRIAWIATALILARRALVAIMAGFVNGQTVAFDNLITRMLFSEGVAIGACALGVLAIVRGDAAIRIASRPVAVGLSALALVGGVLAWNAQDDWTSARDSASGAASLRAQLPPGEIFWLSGDGRSGAWTERPEWWSVNEGASSVFDRTLAMEWARRHDILVRAGLSKRKVEMMEGRDKVRPKLSARALAMVCQAPRGPAAIVAPVDQVAADIRGRASGQWRAPTAANGKPDGDLFLIFRCDGGSGRNSRV